MVTLGISLRQRQLIRSTSPPTNYNNFFTFIWVHEIFLFALKSFLTPFGPQLRGQRTRQIHKVLTSPPGAKPDKGIVRRPTKQRCIWCRYMNGQERKKHAADVLNGVTHASVDEVAGKRGTQTAFGWGHAMLPYVLRAPVGMNITAEVVRIINFLIVVLKFITYDVKLVKIIQRFDEKRNKSSCEDPCCQESPCDTYPFNR